jgi:catechol O-methyltransferase
MLRPTVNTETATLPIWKRVPFLRWTFVKMLLSFPRVMREWQAGDGREEKLCQHVLATAPRGDLQAALRAIDDFGWNQSFLMNVGDEKGLILDAAVVKAKPARILELGTYVGYSALRMAAAAPEARIYCVEFSAANAGIARRIFEHAGVGGRITVVVGTLGDGGATLRALSEQHGFAPGNLDFVFIDHDKAAYLSDLQHIEQQGWLHAGSLVVADNIKFPGAPDYQKYMSEHEGKSFRTTAHLSHVEYQTMLEDVVLVSERLV